MSSSNPVPELPFRSDNGVHAVRYQGHSTFDREPTRKPDIVRVLNYSHSLGPNGEENATKQTSVMNATAPKVEPAVFASTQPPLARTHVSTVDVHSVASPMSEERLRDEESYEAFLQEDGEEASDRVRSSILELCEVKRQQDLLKRLEVKAQRAIALSKATGGPDGGSAKPLTITPAPTNAPYPTSFPTVGDGGIEIAPQQHPPVIESTSAAVLPTQVNLSSAQQLPHHHDGVVTIPADAIVELDMMPFTFNTLGKQYVERKRRVFSATVSRAHRQQVAQSNADAQMLAIQEGGVVGESIGHNPKMNRSSITSSSNHRPQTHHENAAIVAQAFDAVEAPDEDGVPFIHRRGPNVPQDSEANALNDMVDDETLVQCRSAVPIAGKTAFTVPFRLSRPLHELRSVIARAIHGDLFAPAPQHTPQFTIHDNDSPTPLPTNRTFLDLGFRFPPLVTIRGFKPVYYIHTAGSTQRHEAPWSPHMTLTDVCKAVRSKLLPYDFTKLRLSVLDIGRVEHSQAVRRLLPIGPCMRLKSPGLIPSPESTTMAMAGLETRIGDPIRTRFMRTICGVPFYFVVPETYGHDTAWSVAQRGRDMSEEWLQSLRIDPQESRAVLGKIPALLCNNTSNGASPSGKGASRRALSSPEDIPDPNVVPTAALTMRFDDVDESISPQGLMSIYVHRNSAPPPDVPNKKKGAISNPGSYVTLSFNPTSEYLSASRTPDFVSIEENYTIRHATDCGLFIGSIVLVEHLREDRDLWSGDVFEFGTARRLPFGSMSERQDFEKDDDAAGGGSVSSRWLVPREDYLTVRSHRGLCFRVPANTHDPIYVVLERIWGVAGDPPMHTLLFSAEGVLLAPHSTLHQHNIPPSATVFTRERPQMWLDGRPEMEIIQELAGGVAHESKTAWGVDVLQL